MLSRILQSIQDANTTDKTASQKAPASEGGVKQSDLTAALNEAISEKTASARKPETQETGPVADVMKIAQEILDSEQEAATKEAQLIGAAFADAAMARMQEWNKVASQAYQPADFEGYTADDLEKFAAEQEYNEGFGDAVVQIHKLASDEFMKAALNTAFLIEEAAAAQQTEGK